MSVKELLRTFDARELSEWMVYSQLEPWGESRADLRMGILASVVANLVRGKGKPATPADFIPRFDASPEQAEQSQRDQANMNAMATLRGFFADKPSPSHHWTEPR